MLKQKQDNQKLGSLRNRIGVLTENYILNKYDLMYNKRQKTKHLGFYDGYAKSGKLYEIKAIKQDKNAKYHLIEKNHKELIKHAGIYIFVVYELINKDNELSIITDIQINNEIFIHAKDVDKLISGTWKRKNSDKIYCRVLLKKILEYNGVSIDD